MTSRLQSILEAEELADFLPLFTDQEITDAILADLSDSDLKEIGIDKMGVRKRLLAAFNQAPSSGSSEGAAPAQTSASSPSEATKQRPFINSLGMPFVPIPRFETRFCIWPVRVEDYELYCAATGAAYPHCPFPQDSDHPIVGVSWDDSMAFCEWLTEKEREEGHIDENTEYRLPTDLEWSAAVGLPHEPEPTPEGRHLKAPGYPWGLRWPPPENVGNYEHYRIEDHRGYQAQAVDMQREIQVDGYYDIVTAQEECDLFNRSYKKWISSWNPVDSFKYTSPVGSFQSNANGIFDLGGNVWEWCMEAVLRGSSFAHHDFEIFTKLNVPESLDNSVVYRSSYRHKGHQSYAQRTYHGRTGNGYYTPDGGFRIIIECKNQKNKQNLSVKLGRNDSCFCGSGKKFKHCCIK